MSVGPAVEAIVQEPGYRYFIYMDQMYGRRIFRCTSQGVTSEIVVDHEASKQSQPVYAWIDCGGLPSSATLIVPGSEYPEDWDEEERALAQAFQRIEGGSPQALVEVIRQEGWISSTEEQHIRGEIAEREGRILELEGKLEEARGETRKLRTQKNNIEHALSVKEAMTNTTAEDTSRQGVLRQSIKLGPGVPKYFDSLSSDSMDDYMPKLDLAPTQKTLYDLMMGHGANSMTRKNTRKLR